MFENFQSGSVSTAKIAVIIRRARQALSSSKGAKISPQGSGKFMENIIYAYTRKQAIEDGFQVEIDQKTSRSSGIRYPVYINRTVWDRYVEVPKEMTGYQDEAGRLWDILWMFAIKARKFDGAELLFKFICQLPKDEPWLDNEHSEEGEFQRLITLKALVGPVDIDDPSPAITILFPNED